MPAWIYILKLNNGKYYIGSTTNLEKRIIQHQSGLARYTSKYLPALLVFSKKFESYREAYQVEKKLKKFKKKDIIDNIVITQILKIA